MNDFLKKHGLRDEKVYDCHYHIGMQQPIDVSVEYYKKNREYLNLGKMIINPMTERNADRDASSNIKALYCKEFDENTFAFSSLHYHFDERDTADFFLKQIKFYYDAGYDGIKMLEGKSDCRKYFPFKLDDEVFEPYFAFAEEKQYPILLHAGDLARTPEEKELLLSIQDEVENVLKRHPNLKITFAHLFFMTDNREKLTRIMDTYKNTSVDLSMGGPIIPAFSKDLENWKEFITRFSERILFASDNWNRFFDGDDDFEVSVRHLPLRLFFESKEPFTCPILRGVMTNPALLPKRIVDNIYRDNFDRIFGVAPREVNRKMAYEYAKKLLKKYEDGTLKTEVRNEIPSWYFEDEARNLRRGCELAIENIKIIKEHYHE